MTERRYSEDEMAEIFERAAAERSSTSSERESSEGLVPARVEGLTLAQLQEIGEEVGISAEAISRGASAIDLAARTDTGITKYGGMPLGVSRVAPLGRPLTDEEWTRLVVLLRAVFEAPGEVREQAGLREWRNGNLHVTLEPDGEGSRIRLRTRREGWEALPTAGGFSVLASAGVLVAGLIQGDVASMYAGAAALLTMGGGAYGFGFTALRRWARLRTDQFEAVSRAAAEMADQPLQIGEGEEPG